MYPHDYCFYAGCAFLVGVAVALLGIPPLFITCFSLLFAFGCFVHSYMTSDVWMRGFGICIFFTILGSWYVGIRYEQFMSVKVPYGEHITFEGCISNEPKITNASQEVKVSISSPFYGDVRIRMRSSESVAYGDCFHGVGVVSRPPEMQVSYFLKERMYGTIQYPKLSLLEKRKEMFLGSLMISMRKTIMQTFQSALSRDEAIFLAGLTIGAKGEFGDKLQTAMKKSGTTHLVALSGYNIMIIISALMLGFVRFMKKRYAIIVTGFFVFLFCIFAGGESSLVRAAILGCIGMVAGEFGRKFDVRQAVVVAAVAMALINPFVLVFDVGFQLSFAAFLGIAYCSPALMELFHMKDEQKRIKNLFIDALSAQLATLPIIAMQFGTISFVGIISGLILLELIPITMGLGFIASFFSFISSSLALIPLLFARVFLVFELWIIKLFGTIPFFEWKMGPTIFILYYVLLVIFISIYLKRRYVRNRIFTNNKK